MNKIEEGGGGGRCTREEGRCFQNFDTRVIYTHTYTYTRTYTASHEEICIRLQSNPFFAVEKRTLVEPRRSKYNLEKDTVLDI